MTVRDRLTSLSPEQRRVILSGLSNERLEELTYCWPFWARASQRMPEGRHWRTWVLQGGRGAGKTKTAAETIRAEIEAGRRRQICAMGPTAETCRRDMVEGPAGLIAVCPPWAKPTFEAGTSRIVWPNGAVVHLLSAEEPNRARGLNLDMMWIDELTSFSDPDGAWNVGQMALRIPGPLGDPPVCIITTTPRSVPIFKRIRALPTTVVTISPTLDNAQNLSPEALSSLLDQYGGTRLGRQELNAEMIDDVDGALWSRSLLEECRIRRGTEPERMRRVIVAIDPPGASGKTSAECGLIVGALGPDRRGYIVADLSGRLSPEQWARRATDAYRYYKCDRIVAEKNFGGEMVESTLRNVDSNIPLKMVTASRGKQIRAEPIAALFQQHKVHLIGSFDELENQMCSWNPAETGPSPDRVDALVWCLTELMGGPPPMRIDPAALEKSRGFRRHAF